MAGAQSRAGATCQRPRVSVGHRIFFEPLPSAFMTKPRHRVSPFAQTLAVLGSGGRVALAGLPRTEDAP